ncbi:MAG: hypothetical protein RLZZ292_1964, partial [Bacteroidota bacterium]
MYKLLFFILLFSTFNTNAQEKR